LTNVADLFEPKDGREDTDDHVDLKDASNIRSWAVQNTFQKYLYWTRHSRPSNGDRHAKWIEWVTSIAPTIHAPLTAESMMKPFKYTLSPSNSDVPSESGTKTSSENTDIELPEKRGLKRQAPDSELNEPSASKKPASTELP